MITNMNQLPQGFIMPTTYQQTDNPLLLKPVFGTVDGQYVRFFMHFVYAEAKSKEAGFEVMDQIEMCEIVEDSLTKAHLRVKDLSRKQQMEFSDLYDRFKNRKESQGTHISQWTAISEADQALLMHCNIFTVEQLAGLQESDKHRLGPSGKELLEKAERHLRSKGEQVKASEYAQEMKLLREELEQIKAKERAREDMSHKRLAAMAKARSAKKPKKVKPVGEEAHAAAA